MIMLELVVNARDKVNVAAVHGGDCWLGVIERLESFLDFFLEFGQTQQACIGAGGLHVLGNGSDTVIAG